MSKQTILSVIGYAKASGVTRAAIYARIRAGVITPTIKKLPDDKERTYIDIRKNPIRSKSPRGPKGKEGVGV